MKIYIKILATFAIISTLLINSYGTNPTSPDKTLGLYDYRETEAFPKDLLFAEAFYDEGLKGKLQTTKKEPFLLSSLQLVGKKPPGLSQEGVYKDSRGDIWFVKKAQFPIHEYLGSKVMDLLIGPLSLLK